MKRIVDKDTKLFLRDDFTFDEQTELALDVAPAQGLYRPKWDGEKWVEDMTAEEIEALTSNIIIEPTAEERLAGLEQVMLDMMGGMF